ncbi:MAG: serine acetyltransferase [Anaerolineae bacterium]|nr:serine acetyltransferase [Anaerolineae bacterium]
MQDLSRDLKRYCDGSPAQVVKAVYNHPALVGVIWYRVGRGFWLKRKNPLWMALLILNRLFYPLIRMYSGVELSPRVQIGPGLYIAHFGPTVIHPETVSGSDLTLLHGVTIGASTSGVPRLGNNVNVGAGAIIIGGITVGDNVHIGANAVVTRDVEGDCTVVGIPANPIPKS